MARRELRPTTQILRAGNAAKSSRYASPVMGDRGPTPLVKGRWPKARGDREGEYGHEVSILSRPPAILWFLSHRWERNSPRRAKPSCNRRKGSITAPSSAPFGGTFPPGGRLKKSRRRNLPHRSRPTSIPCLPTLPPPCKPTVSKTKTTGWWRADRPSARLTGRR